MKQTIIILLCMFSFSANAQSILGRVKQAASNTAVNKTQQIADKELDKTIASATNNNKPAVQTEQAQSKPTGGKPQKSFKFYTHYDYVPGDQVFYADNFEGAHIGELPLGWNTNGNGMVVILDSIQGNWLKMNQNATYLSANKTPAAKDFTVEFDLLTQFTKGSYILPEYHFGLIATGKKTSVDNSLLKDQRGDKMLQFGVRPGFDEHTFVSLKGYQGNEEYFPSPTMEYFSLEYYNGKVMHVAICIQKQRARIWINGDKLFDIPAAIPEEGNFNQFYFSTGTSNYKNTDLGFYVSNLKMANGLPDTRSKLLDEGKYSTTGILFEVSKYEVKPQSFGVLNEIGKVLQENPSLSVKITGHTDADGDANANELLSLNRAGAVKDLIVAQYGIVASRLHTDGAGASKPVADNKTNTGKAQNRRVEFTKL